MRNKKEKTLTVNLTSTGLLNTEAGPELSIEDIRYIAHKLLAMYPVQRKPVNQKIDIPIDKAV